MNSTIKLLLVTIFFLSTSNSNSQIIDGTCSVYKGALPDMDKSDGWKRVELNGGFKNQRNSYIKFSKEDIILNIAKTETDDEIYIVLKPQYSDYFQKMTVFGDIFYESILTIGNDYTQNVIQYFKSKLFNDNKGTFIISVSKNKTMYIFKCEKNEDKLVGSLYKSS